MCIAADPRGRVGMEWILVLVSKIEIPVDKYMTREIRKGQEMNIYVGNLPYKMADRDLQELFEQYGEVQSASVIMDKFSGKSKGFGFVEMSSQDDAQKAIDSLNETSVMGRNIRVNEARPREDRGGGGGGGGRRPRRY
jgi:RNA recognition motif-containing protein